jgi:hypothetical protein
MRDPSVFFLRAESVLSLLPKTHRDRIVGLIADELDRAYRQGAADARLQMRVALGIEERDGYLSAT